MAAQGPGIWLFIGGAAQAPTPLRALSSPLRWTVSLLIPALLFLITF